MSLFTEQPVPANEVDEEPLTGGLHLAAGRASLLRDSKALSELATTLDATFERSVDILLSCSGKVFVCGDDSKHPLGARMASVLSRIGIPSIWIHSADAQENQCSFASKRDVLLFLSNHANSETLIRLLPLLDARAIRSVGVFLQAGSLVARRLTAVLSCTSLPRINTAGRLPEYYLSALSMALIDAVASAKRVTLTPFEALHDEQWMKRLLLKAGDLMRTDYELATVSLDTPWPEVLVRLKASELQMVCVTTNEAELAGVIGAQEIIRAQEIVCAQEGAGERKRMDAENSEHHKSVAKDFMLTPARSIDVHTPVGEAMRLMKHEKLDVLPVKSEIGQLVGILSLHDLLI